MKKENLFLAAASGLLVLTAAFSMQAYLGRATPASAAAASIGGYDIIIVAGQSNAVAGNALGPFSDPAASDAVDAKIMQLGRNGADNLKVIPATLKVGGVSHDALQNWTGDPQHKQMSFAIPFARRYAVEQLAPSRKVLIIPAAMGGTSILKWLGEINDPPTAPASLYADMVHRTKVALALPGKNQVVAFLWLQGEKDVGFLNAGNYLGMDAAVYQEKLASLLHKLRADLPARPPYPVIASELAPTWLRDDAQKFLAKNRIQLATKKAFAADPKGGVISANALPSNYPAYTTDEAQRVHFTAQSEVVLGGRYYTLWKQLQGLR